ncbi:hypothetical protein P154DRAFT_450033 [Amniculicola lignicola CBS 123094]|uniref:Rhodopsin domain-containing protein n=1 Tax=Amniculicola lignicola CBS 123094 TaxID=1392246 RepID=A0A6A5VXW1_9PLEO|nr:hypothetical protein P154DRAFT_450033 [Amniculicola lignicola CBS 123094]
MDPKYTEGAEEARQHVMIAVAVVMTLIGLSCVGLRVYTRAYIVRNIGIEDWTMIAAAGFTMVFFFELMAAASEFKFGFSGMSMSPSDMENNIKMTMAIIVIYKLTMTLIKLSILIMYLRLAVEKLFARLCIGTMVLLIVWQFIVIVVVPSQCIPLRKAWDFTGMVKGRCINANTFFLTTSAFHIVMDVWILALPVKLFLSIRRPFREKIALFFVFGLGIFSTIASITRFQFLRLFIVSKDPFYDAMPINLWSMVEVNVGILCASVSTLRPLFSKAQRLRTKQALSKSDGEKLIKKHKKGGLSQGLFITLTMASMRGGTVKDEEFEMENTPPPVPPKDEKYDFSPVSSKKLWLPYPDAAYKKI